MTMTAASDPLAGLTFAFAPLSGAVEHGLAQQSGSAQSRARWLLEAVVAGLARDGAPLALADLTLAQFDALLAAFYRVHYDDVMPAQARCGGCDEPFEISFRLSDVQARLAVGAADFAGGPPWRADRALGPGVPPATGGGPCRAGSGTARGVAARFAG